MPTNRDLYLSIAQLIECEKNSERSFEEYLRALYGLGEQYQGRESLSIEEFIALVSRAFSAPPVEFDITWRNLDHHSQDEHRFEGWKTKLREQIIDLREMGQEGILQDEYCYFGVDAPRGSRWYNFDPCALVECGAMGTFGGWQSGDDIGREYVPGEVLVMNEQGALESKDPREIEDPTFELETISWETFAEFLLMGQMYE